MDKKIGRINRNMMIGWLAMTVVLSATYIIELLKGARTPEYIIPFLAVTIIPPIIGLVHFLFNKNSTRLRYFAAVGYLIMYTYVLLNTNTIMTYGYIIPMLSLMVLYHTPSLVLGLGIYSLGINIAADIRLIHIGYISAENNNIKDMEIQLGMILFCYTFAFMASVIYKRIVVENARHIEEIDEKQKQLERVTLQTITTIANIIDAKDEYTKGHSYRVAEYSSMLAREMGYSEERVADIRFIGLLHDIGKIGIPDAILNKPGKLTDSEYALMRKHAEIGGNILEGNNMIEGMDEGARYHHERYDGHGYPQGLAGEEIPEIARIIGIADAYDAMTSNRVYRRRLTNETVMEEIKRCAGTQFDPKITQIFIKMLEDGRLEHIVPDAVPDDENKSRAERSAELLSSVIGFHSEKYDSKRDYLTGVFSKDAGEESIGKTLSAVDGGLFIADVTNLQGVNARHGIVAGDHVIKTVADELCKVGGLIVVRYDGSGFLCFMPAMFKREEFLNFMEDTCDKISDVLAKMPECDSNNYMCFGGVLSNEMGSDFRELCAEAEKALFHIKQLKRNGCYLFNKSERIEGDEVYRMDLGLLIDMIKAGANAAKTPPEADAEEFMVVYNMVRGIYEDNTGSVWLLLLTVTPAVGRTATVADRDEAMDYLEKVINNTPEVSCTAFRFTSVQFLVILTDIGESGAIAMKEHILNGFYKVYNRPNMALSPEVAYLPPHHDY